MKRALVGSLNFPFRAVDDSPKFTVDQGAVNLDERSILFIRAAVAGGLPRICVSATEDRPEIVGLFSVEGDFLRVNVPDLKSRLSIGVQILDADPPAQGVNISGRMTEEEQVSLGLPTGWQLHEAVQRVRLILEEIYRVFSGGEVRSASLLHVDGELISELVSLLGARAEDKGVSFQDLWTALAQHWVSENQMSPMSFLNAGLQSNAIIRINSVLS